MMVGVAQIDGKWPNLALAKLTAWHRSKGDSVEQFMPLANYDRVYASKVFSDTPPNQYLPVSTVCGGTGYDYREVLPDEIERTKPDFSLWPFWPHDMGFSTRGCVRRCPFCVVPEKEGKLRVVAEFGDLTTGRPTLILNDNNLTAAPIEHFRKLAEDAKAAGVRLDPRQGLDARLLTDEHAAIIASGLFARRIHLAFDHMADEDAVRRAIKTFADAGIVASRLTFYVLIGFDTTPEQDMYRVQLVRSLGADPFVMRYDRSDRYQTRFARWVNQPVAFNSMTWDEWQATFRMKVTA